MIVIGGLIAWAAIFSEPSNRKVVVGPATVNRDALVCVDAENYSTAIDHLSIKNFRAIERMPGCSILKAGTRVEVRPEGGFTSALLERSTIVIRAPGGSVTKAVIADNALTASN